MATNSAQKVATANAQAAAGTVGGAVTSSGKIVGGSYGNGGTTAANPKDTAGYLPGASADDKVGPITQMTNDLSNATAPVATPPAPTPTPTNQVSTPSGLPGQANLTGTTQQQATQAIDQLKSVYGGALTQANQSKVAAPQNAGAGSAGVTQLLNAAGGTQQEADSRWNNIYEIDPGVDKDFMNYDDLMSPTKQKQTLVQEYDALSKSLGLESINSELINDKRIIEGTEDDIRSEITAAGGLATDSQVQAMANARNKSLIKNYNTLLDTKNSLSTQLSTMMQLSIQDRQMAEAEFDRKLNFGFKVAEFKQRATDNARSTYASLISSGHADALLGDSYQNSLIEKTLGLGSGSLQKLALEAVGKRGADNLKTQVVDVNGRKLLVNSQTGETIKEIGAGTGGGSGALQLAGTQQNINQVDTLLTDPAIRTAVGPTFLGRFVGRGLDTATGSRQNFIAGVETLRSQLTLDSLIDAKARGATFGALSEGELKTLSASASKIGTWAKKNDAGNVVAYNASEKDFKAELNKINNFAKLDFILKGGDPATVGVQIMPNGIPVVQNSDGTYTELK